MAERIIRYENTRKKDNNIVELNFGGHYAIDVSRDEEGRIIPGEYVGYMFFVSAFSNQPAEGYLILSPAEDEEYLKPALAKRLGRHVKNGQKFMDIEPKYIELDVYRRMVDGEVRLCAEVLNSNDLGSKDLYEIDAVLLSSKIKRTKV